MRIGDDSYRSVSSSLAQCALSGTRSGTPGQPMPQDVAIKDQASAVAAQFSAGSPPYRFYNSLAGSAEGSIRNQLLRDEELFTVSSAGCSSMLSKDTTLDPMRS